MLVWWSVIAFALIISTVGMSMYKSNTQTNVSTVNSSNIEEYKSIGLFFAIFSFALLILFVGQRSWIFDTATYQYMYERTPSDLSYIGDLISGKTNEKGVGFFVLTTIFKHFTNGAYNEWFTFVALIQCICIAVFLYKNSIDYRFSLYIFFTTSCFFWMINGMRQFLSVTIMLFFFDFIKKRKLIPFLIVIYICYTIHSSALFWIPVYFIIGLKPWSKKFVILSVIMSVALAIISTSSMLNDSEYSYVATNETDVNIFRVIVMSVPAILAFIKRKEIEKKASKNINMLINISVICSECFIVGMFTSAFVARLAVYFQIINYALLPWILKYGYNEKDSRMIRDLCIVLFMAYFCYDVYIAGNGIYQSQNLHIY